MGWSGGAEIFDPVVETLNRVYGNLNNSKSIQVIEVLVEALDNCDWDCQYESSYWLHPIVGKLLGNDFEEEE